MAQTILMVEHHVHERTDARTLQYAVRRSFKQRHYYEQRDTPP
jgi:hypothetical protein